MDTKDTNILLGFLAALVTIVGWFVAYYLTKRREMHQRRQELMVKHLERQIEEFYGPLFNLVEQIFACEEVQSDILEEDTSPAKRHLSDEQQAQVRDFLYHDYFQSLHDEMRLILKTKLFLVEGEDVPESFDEYLRHSTQERVQKMLWERLHVDTSYIQGRSWPKGFYTDIKSGLDSVMLQYEQMMEGLRRQQTFIRDDEGVHKKQ